MEQQWIVAYIISHIMTLCCLTFYILIFERVLWFNHLYKMVEYCNYTTWDVWYTHMSKDEHGQLMCIFDMSNQVAFDEGRVAHQNTLNMYLKKVRLIKDSPHTA